MSHDDDMESLAESIHALADFLFKLDPIDDDWESRAIAFLLGTIGAHCGSRVSAAIGRWMQACQRCQVESS